MNPLRLGIVGCGAVVEQYHLPAIDRSELVTLEALVDASAERARALAAMRNARVVGDHRELAGVVDAVIVAVPNVLHAPVASDLLRAGIHVLVEKPLATTVAGCDAILKASEAGGTTVAVGHDFRFAPAVQLVKELLARSSLGDVRGFDLRHGTESRWPLETSYLFEPQHAGGGVLLDHGAHLLDHILWWLGPCTVESYRDDVHGGVESNAEIQLRTEAGIPGFVELSRTRTLRNTCRIDGEHAALDVEVFKPLARVALHLSASVPVLEGPVGDKAFASDPYRALFERQLEDFARAIMTGGQPLVAGEDGRRTVALIEECYAVREPLEFVWDYPQCYEAVP